MPPTTIPIYRLSHITHLHQKLSIFRGKSNYIFKPDSKYGKSSIATSDQGAGITYRHKSENTYKKISSSDQVFPGYLSWWGIDVRKWYAEVEKGNELLQRVVREKENGRYVPGYLDHPTESRYGDQAFSTSLSQILQDYYTARCGQTPCLKVGGTLCYQYEICYVVIVCTRKDKLDMPSITTSSSQFVANDKGFVIDYEEIPEFNVTSIIRKKKAGVDPTGRRKYLYKRFNWEQLTFAFYFPERDQHLVCKDVDMSVVSHHKERCQKC